MSLCAIWQRVVLVQKVGKENMTIRMVVSASFRMIWVLGCWTWLLWHKKFQHFPAGRLWKIEARPRKNARRQQQQKAAAMHKWITNCRHFVLPAGCTNDDFLNWRWFLVNNLDHTTIFMLSRLWKYHDLDNSKKQVSDLLAIPCSSMSMNSTDSSCASSCLKC